MLYLSLFKCISSLMIYRKGLLQSRLLYITFAYRTYQFLFGAIVHFFQLYQERSFKLHIHSLRTTWLANIERHIIIKILL